MHGHIGDPTLQCRQSFYPVLVEHSLRQKLPNHELVVSTANVGSGTRTVSCPYTPYYELVESYIWLGPI